MTYQLSCRKCNKHLTVGTTDKDLKTTMGDHFDEVKRLVNTKGKCREDADKFARYFAKHMKPKFRKKVPSDNDILKFCQEHAKIEVLNTEARVMRLGMDKTAMSMRNNSLDSSARTALFVSSMDSILEEC